MESILLKKKKAFNDAVREIKGQIKKFIRYIYKKYKFKIYIKHFKIK